MDGLTRRELEFVPLRVKRSISRALEDKDDAIRAYVVGGRNVLKSWVSDGHLHDSITSVLSIYKHKHKTINYDKL